MRCLKLHAASALIALLVAACSGTGTGEGPPSQEAPLPPETTARPKPAPAGWLEVAPWEFEQLVEGLSLGPWEPAALEQFALALARQDLGSVRAAVLLAHGDRAARDVLVSRLEARVEGPERESDAGDVIAAAALARWSEPELVARLSQLAVGPAPHPDLEVRVECAATALAGEAEEVVPFLLRVLSAGTPAELQDPIDWTPTDKLAWAKMRAADALCRRAGLDLLYQPDGSFQQQLADVERLRSALAPGS